ncbi:hypothetical protein AB4Z30_21945 [Paenibacillus sp. 2TAF8]|jgi:hypothetical protein|uniref:hypothetical protein n=1 Tax=Paenibacillus sp. 2TAF8 TaxID=3233020 RepID=UPI003F9CF7D1
MKAAKTILSSVVAIGVITTLSGVSQVSADQGSKMTSQISVKAASVEPDLYQEVPKFKKTLSKDKVIWNGKNIELIANIVEEENVPASESKVIRSIVISKGKMKQTIKADDLGEKWHEVIRVVDSNSGDWVAVQVAKSAGNAVILVNLKTGESTILNDRLAEEGKKGVESIPSFNWSPVEDKLAISYGNTEKSSLAIYDAKKGTFEYIPRTTNYISTGVILWHKNGKSFDYISEYPSDQMSLFRYNTATKKVKPIKKMTQKEFQQFMKLDK